jgi:hypothetical protein
LELVGCKQERLVVVAVAVVGVAVVVVGVVVAGDVVAAVLVVDTPAVSRMTSQQTKRVNYCQPWMGAYAVVQAQIGDRHHKQ